MGYLQKDHALAIVLTGFISYILYIIISLLVISCNKFAQKYLQKTTTLAKILVKFNIGLFLQEIITGLISTSSYFFILQFQYYTDFSFPPVITFFYFASLVYLLKNISLLINWGGYLLLLYFMENTAQWESYWILLTASTTSLITIYLLKWQLKKRYHMFALLKSLILLTIILVSCFVFSKKNNYFDWITNIFTSYGITLFLETIGTWFLSKYKWISYLKNKQIYSYHFFVNQTSSWFQLQNFLSTNHVNFGVFLTFDYVFTNQKKHHYYLESYLNSLLKLMLKKYQKLFLIAPDFNYAVFIALNGTKSKSEQLLNFRQHLITIVNYLNQLINASANNGYFKVFYADFGATFYDLVPLIKITELGIYNLDYTDQVYCKQFQQKHFLAELTTAKEKKQLKVWLEQYQYQSQLEHNNHYYYLNLVSIKKFLFTFDNFWTEISSPTMQTIFLRKFAYLALTKYWNLPSPKLPLKIPFTYHHLLANDYEFGKLINKIKNHDIQNNQIIFDFSYAPKVKRISEQNGYAILRSRLLNLGFQIIDPKNFNFNNHLPLPNHSCPP